MPFKLLLVVIGGFTPDPVGFIGVFIAAFPVLFKGNFLSVPGVVVPGLGFYSFTYGFFTTLLTSGFTYGSLLPVAVFVVVVFVVVEPFFGTTLLTVVDDVFVDVTLFFSAKSTFDGSLLSWTEDCVYFAS